MRNVKDRGIAEPREMTEVVVSPVCESCGEVDGLIDKGLAVNTQPMRPSPERGSMSGRSFEGTDGLAREPIWMNDCAKAPTS